MSDNDIHNALEDYKSTLLENDNLPNPNLAIEILYRFFHDPIAEFPKLQIISPATGEETPIPKFCYGKNMFGKCKLWNHDFITISRKEYFSVGLNDELSKELFWQKWFAAWGDPRIYRLVENKVLTADLLSDKTLNSENPWSKGSKRRSGKFSEKYFDKNDTATALEWANLMKKSFIKVRTSFINCYKETFKDGLECRIWPNKRTQETETFLKKHFNWDNIPNKELELQIPERGNTRGHFADVQGGMPNLEKITDGNIQSKDKLQSLIDDINVLQQQLNAEKDIRRISESLVTVPPKSEKDLQDFINKQQALALPPQSNMPPQMLTPIQGGNSKVWGNNCKNNECRLEAEWLKNNNKNSWDVMDTNVGLRWFKNGNTSLRVNSRDEIEKYIYTDPPIRDPLSTSFGRKRISSSQNSKSIAHILVNSTLGRFRTNPKRAISSYKKINSQFGSKQQAINNTHLRAAYPRFRMAHFIHSIL